MTTRFRVRSFRDGDAAAQTQWLEAANAVEARAALQAQGFVVLDLRPASRLPALRRSEPPRARFALFCREVRTLVAAGMTVVEAVDTLCARGRGAVSDDTLGPQLLAKLQRGQARAVAREEIEGVPPVLVAAVRAGERTSNLVESLDDYLRFDTLVEQLRRKVVSAAIYPLLVTSLGFGISVFLLAVVMPNFARMYANLRGTSSGAAALMVQFSVWASHHRGLLLAALVLLGAALAWGLRQGWGRRAALAAGRRVPWLRERTKDFQLAMMYQALALLLKGGYSMVEAMGVAGGSTTSQELRAALAGAVEKIKRGGRVSEALSEAALCDEVGRRLLAAAERNGDFFLAAEVVSRLHGERFELFVERASRVVEPLLLMAVALMVGTIVVMMYLPVFDMATQLR